jgi:hypothetical protein
MTSGGKVTEAAETRSSSSFREAVAARHGDLGGEAPIGPAERAAALLLLAVTVGLHVFYSFRWTLDSDEWQHLHVAWAWTQGLLQYRDVFDNHTPLFHMLTAPLVAAFGETPDIHVLMRLAMLPLMLTALAGAAAIGRALSGRRAALWTPAVRAAVPIFFFRSIEYRTDALWTAFWVVAIAVLVTGRSGAGRAFATGLLLGLAVCASLKTLFLLFALGLGLVLTPLVVRRDQRGAPLQHLASRLAAGLTGLVAPGIAIVLYFVHRGALDDLVGGAIRHNILPGLGTWDSPLRRLLFLPEIAAVAGLAGWLARRQPGAGAARRTALVVLTAGGLLATLQTLWPLFTTYDLLVFYPLVVPVVIGAMLRQGASREAARDGAGAPHAWRFAALVVLFLGLVFIWSPPQHDGVSRQRAFLSEVLRLTDPGDLVLDQKGDSIFRRRPSPYVLERITRARLERGLLPEHIQEDVVATGTCVAAARIGRFPDRTRAFLVENFLPVGQVLVAGRFLSGGEGGADPAGSFDLVIPARYALVAEGGEVTGLLDGEPYTGPRHLDAGHHTFKVSFQGRRLAVIWAQAAERGFLPFGAGRPSS